MEINQIKSLIERELSSQDSERFDRARSIIERELSGSWNNPKRFGAVYKLRDYIDVTEQLEGLTPEQRVNLAWEVRAGVYGDDSPYHSFYHH